MLALTGETPALQIANIVMPTEAEREERRYPRQAGRDRTQASGARIAPVASAKG
jgi:hypothetical protein